MIGVRSFYKKSKKDNAWIDYRLVLSNLKTAELQFLVSVGSDVNDHVTLENFQRWPQGVKYFLTYQCAISSDKTKFNLPDCAE